jgi:hypothetical protein
MPTGPATLTLNTAQPSTPTPTPTPAPAPAQVQRARQRRQVPLHHQPHRRRVAAAADHPKRVLDRPRVPAGAQQASGCPSPCMPPATAPARDPASAVPRRPLTARTGPPRTPPTGAPQRAGGVPPDLPPHRDVAPRRAARGQRVLPHPGRQRPAVQANRPGGAVAAAGARRPGPGGQTPTERAWHKPRRPASVRRLPAPARPRTRPPRLPPPHTLSPTRRRPRPPSSARCRPRRVTWRRCPSPTGCTARSASASRSSASRRTRLRGWRAASTSTCPPPRSASTPWPSLPTPRCAGG